MTTADTPPDRAPQAAAAPARRDPLARAWVPAIAVAAGVLVGALGVYVAHRRARANVPVVLRDDPGAFVPFGVRGVLVADVARLRAAPSLRPLFGAAPGPDEPCESALLRRVGRVAVAVPAAGLEDFAVAFTGDLPQRELLACARARRGGGGAELSNDHYRGMDVLRMVARREGGLLPPANPAEIIYVPGGTVVAGAAPTARRMVDHALSGVEPAEDDTAVFQLRRRIGPGRALALAYYLGPGGLGALGVDDPALAHVVGVALGADVDGDGLRATVVLACDDFDAPRAVADALLRARDEAAPRLRLPALADTLRGARVERRAAEVRVELALSGPQLDALATIASALLAPPPDDAPRPPPSTTTSSPPADAGR